MTGKDDLPVDSDPQSPGRDPEPVDPDRDDGEQPRDPDESQVE
ncbi:hypothetical protein ACPA5B_16470 [Pseudomonas solani]